jgi:hypothetical protein
MIDVTPAGWAAKLGLIAGAVRRERATRARGAAVVYTHQC